MKMKKCIGCAANFSEGRNLFVIQIIIDSITKVRGIKLLNIDSGKSVNRTVITFAGNPEDVLQAAFNSAQAAKNNIDMRKHKGVHPCIGAMDVCPLIPLKNISIEETTEYARKLAQRIGEELVYPVYCYGESAYVPERRDLVYIRKGGYKKLAYRIQVEQFFPDFGPNSFCSKTGATAIGARNFLIAYNVNLNTLSPKIASSIASVIRKKIPFIKTMGWYIKEYNKAQVSINLTNIHAVPLHMVFEACREEAEKRNIKVTGSELIGMAPLKIFVDAGNYFYKKYTTTAKSTEEKNYVQLAIQYLGLNELYAFNPDKRIIELYFSQRIKRRSNF